MITYEKVLILKNVPFFEKASELALSDLVSTAKENTIKAGEVLVDVNKENDSLYLVLNGCLTMEVNKKNTLDFGPRQMVGETTVFSPGPLLGKVVASEKTTLLKWNADQLYMVMSLHPSLAQAFLGTLSHRLKMFEKNEKAS